MKTRITYKVFIIAVLGIVIAGCSMTRKPQRRGYTADIMLAKPQIREDKPRQTVRPPERILEIEKDGKKNFILNTVEDQGEQIAAIDIEQISVVTTTKTVAERMGEITIDFMISIPATLQSRNWGVYFTPMLDKDGQVSALDKIVIRGEVFSDLQKRQYWQFDKYLNRISGRSGYCENSNELLAKYYEVHNDLSQKRRAALDRVYTETVKFPYVVDSRLDSVINRGGETFRYYYTQTIKTTPGIRKLKLCFAGEIRAIDNTSIDLPGTDTLEYIVTSMISLVDETPVYKKQIIEKYVTVNDKYSVVFPPGKAQIIDTMAQNRMELFKMEKMFRSLMFNYEFFIDSVILTATGSPDGSLRLNTFLVNSRAKMMQDYLSKRIGADIDTLIKPRAIAEDWEELKRLILRDTVVQHKNEIFTIIAKEDDPDRREREIMKAYPQEYVYLKTQLYPLLRAVHFRYALRRVGMVKDTVWTTTLDSAYMQGVKHLKNREYVKALEILEPYKNRNTAIVLLSLGYDQAAYEILNVMAERSAREDYLLAVACSRLNRLREGRRYFDLACEKDPVLKFRSNLDPEIQILLKSQTNRL